MPEENEVQMESTDVVDNPEASIEVLEEPGDLYTVKIDGDEQQVTLEELQNGYSRQQDYTRKTQELANQRKDIESQQAELRQKDDIYKDLLPKLEANLKAELGEEPDWKAIYDEDPIAYVREKDVWNEKQKRLEAAQAEQQRIKDEELAEQQKQVKI